jgi:hypothetical protein
VKAVKAVMVNQCHKKSPKIPKIPKIPNAGNHQHPLVLASQGFMGVANVDGLQQDVHRAVQ